MATVLLAWELGANLGHLARLCRLAQHLRERGRTPVFALRDLRGAEEAGANALGAVWQAPLRLGAGRNPVAVQVNFASLLNNIGFDDILGLAASLRAWRQLIAQIRPDTVVCDHAPTAMLASRSLGLPCTLIGTGFTVPPVQTPFPLYQPERAIEPGLLLRNEAAVLGNLNSALARLKLPELPSLQAIFKGVESRVLSYPETDHYPAPRAEPHLGLPDAAIGAAPVWPGDGPPAQKKIFAYVQTGPGLKARLDALQATAATVLVRIGGARAEGLHQQLRPGMLVTNALVNMRLAAEQCDAYLSYGGHGLVLEMLLAGKPGLLLPDAIERALVARRAEALGAALVLPANTAGPALTEALNRLTSDPTLRAAASAFAARHAGQDRGQILARLADEVVKPFSP